MAKSSAYPPLDSLVDLACRDGVDIRPTLLRVLTDLYVQKPVHSADEEAQYVELARGLLDTVDDSTRAAVATRLAAYPAAPAEILDRLGVPAQTPNQTVWGSDRHDLTELFFAATTDERRLILTDLAMSAELPAPPSMPVANETIHRLESAALQRNPAEFARVLERALGIGKGLAERITRDDSGEPLVVAARALGMNAAVLHRVLLFLNPAIGHSVERVYDLARLYDELTPAAGEYMVAVWREASGRSRSAHQPVYWDDDRREARALSTPARYRSDRGRITQSSYVKSGGK